MILFIAAFACYNTCSKRPDDWLQRKMKATISCGPERAGYAVSPMSKAAGKGRCNTDTVPAGNERDKGCSHQQGAGSLCSNDHKRRLLKPPVC